MPESIQKNFFQPISSWVFDNDRRIIESMDNFYLLAIVSVLLGTSAFFYKNYCLKNNLPVPWIIIILGFLFGNRGGSDIGGHTGGDGGGDGGGGGE